MGKVGSTSIEHSLTKHDLLAIHIHTLQKSFSPFSKNWPPNHAHQTRSDFAKKLLSDGFGIKIISGVRDPVARNISAFFQNLSYYGFNPKSTEPEHTDALISVFFKDFSHAEPLDWFDREIKQCIGIDVFEHEFNGEYAIIQARHPLLILKTEATDEKKEEGIKELTGEKIKLSRKNTADDKSYSGAYREFMAQIRFQKQYLDRMYNSKYCRHFYSQKEIEEFRQKWRE